MESLKTFDAYAKPLDDFKIKTSSGGIISIVSAALITLLIVSEFIEFQKITIKPELVVDKTRRERLKINVNISFHYIPCNLLNMDIMDVVGEQQNDLWQVLHKQRLDQWGKPIGVPFNAAHVHDDDDKNAGHGKNDVQVACGACYGAAPPESGCCNTCEDVRQAYARMGWGLGNISSISQCINEGWTEGADFDKHEGCMMFGTVDVNKVSGNFHFAPGKSFQQNSYHIHDIQSVADHLKDFHFGHTINSLSFGDVYYGMSNPLDHYIKEPSQKGVVFFQYYVKVVPTKIKYLNGSVLMTNQYAVTEYEKPPSHETVPGVFFNYDISSMMVIYTESKQSFTSFLTEVCAVVGGIFAVARLLDTFIYSAERTLARKVELGKQN